MTDRWFPTEKGDPCEVLWERSSQHVGLKQVLLGQFPIGRKLDRHVFSSMNCTFRVQDDAGVVQI